MDDYKSYVARFNNHPIPGVRYMKDIYGWYLEASEYRPDKIKEEIKWGLGHHQYHFSTDDMNSADMFNNHNTKYMDAIKELFDIEFIEVSFRIE